MRPTQYNTCKSLKIKLYVMIYHQCIGDNGGSRTSVRFHLFLTSLKLLLNQKSRRILTWKDEEER